MRLGFRPPTVIGVALALFLGASVAPPALAQQPNGRAGRGGVAGFIESRDPRVQNRTYHFADTNVELPFCVFVSSKVSKGTKSPLIVSLHGLGIGPGFMCQGKAIDLAEEGGYLLVAPMGYRVGGWYGSPVINTDRRGGPGAAAEQPANLAELSEKDVLNVLAMIRQEFTVDDKRTYLMGHSMGGAGTLFLGSKHATEWAAIAAMAPAAFRLANDKPAILNPLKEKDVAVMVTQGDADTLVPVAGTRAWIDAMKDLHVEHRYKEIPGADHGSVIEQGMPDIFAFFKEHTK